jgi:exodeoxyribonuclease III
MSSEKYSYKMAFLADLRRHITPCLTQAVPFVLGGDFNIAPTAQDIWQAPAKERILYSAAERQALQRILHDGMTDTYRALFPHTRAYSWWDYRTNSFEKEEGWRIDFLLANAAAADRLVEAGIDPAWRALEKPSDHTPVWCTLR